MKFAHVFKYGQHPMIMAPIKHIYIDTETETGKDGEVWTEGNPCVQYRMDYNLQKQAQRF